MYSPRKQGPGRAKNVKALKMVISAIVVIPALAHIFYIGATSSLTNYYLSVDELLAQGPSLRGEEVRLAGEVVPGSIEWEWSTSTLRFQVGDKGSIPVIYRGLPPDTFRGHHRHTGRQVRRGGLFSGLRPEYEMSPFVRAR